MKTKNAGLTIGVASAATAGMMLLAAGPASAAEAGFYVAVDVGMSSYDIKKSELDDVAVAALEAVGLTVVDATSDFDKSPTGYGLAIGYRFNPNVAVEASYLTLGKAKWDATGTVTDGGPNFDVDMGIGLKSSGPALSVIGSWPVGESFSLDGRVGAYFSKTRISVSISDGTNSESVSDSQSDTGVLFGVGGTWSFNPALSLRFGYTMYKDAVGGDRDVNQFSAGLQYTFLKHNK